MSITHGYDSASPCLVSLCLLDKKMDALLDPGDIVSCGVDSGFKSASGIPSILANPQEPKETKCEGRFQHQPVVSTEWIAVQ